MIPSASGYVPSTGSFRRMLEDIPELKAPGMPLWSLLEFDPLLDSSDIAVREWNKLGRAIAERYSDFDGFVVLHGTDTMSYSASALSFMLENLNKPVVFTGAQIPLCQLRSDGRDNMVNSLLIAASDKVHEVCLYFNGKLLRGNRSTKKSSDQLEAFASPNAPCLAEAGISIQYNEAAIRQPRAGEMRLQELCDIPIGVLKVFPGIQFELFTFIMTEQLKGIVLETFGAGNIPTCQNALLPIIQKAHDNGAIITVCSQCMQGAVSLGAYAASKALQDIGAVSGKDLTTEAAVTKLYYLFSRYTDKNVIREKMSQNLCGEIS